MSKKCLECETNIVSKDIRTKFCSISCSTTYNNKGKKHSKETKIKISKSLGGKGIFRNKNCLSCNKELPKAAFKFCNNTCRGDLKRKEKIKLWLEGEISGNSQVGHALFVKQYLLEKHNNKCSICGWNKKNPFTKTIPLEVEHIDGNAYNNDSSNVILLCPNCHSLTKTYKGANKGNGKRCYRK